MQAVKLTKTFTVTGIEGPDLDTQTDLVMDELVSLEEETVFDSDLSVDFAENTVQISIAARGDSFEEAMARADSCIRAAIHAAGGHTPRWTEATFATSKSEADLVTT